MARMRVVSSLSLNRGSCTTLDVVYYLTALQSIVMHTGQTCKGMCRAEPGALVVKAADSTLFTI
jgi:hypothetical protein